jgi:hypothetical protein
MSAFERKSIPAATPGTTPGSPDNRRSVRHRVLQPAKIAFGRAGILDATLRNISDHGACLQVASPLGIPENFNLLLDHDRTRKPCRVVWRKEKQIGVEFEGVDGAIPPRAA